MTRVKLAKLSHLTACMHFLGDICSCMHQQLCIKWLSTLLTINKNIIFDEGEYVEGKETSGTEDVNDFIEADGKEQLDDG